MAPTADVADTSFELRRLAAHIILNARIDFGLSSRGKVPGAFSDHHIDVEAAAEVERGLEWLRISERKSAMEPLWIGICLRRTAQQAELLELWYISCTEPPPGTAAPVSARRGDQKLRQQQQRVTFLRQLHSMVRQQPTHFVAQRLARRRAPSQIRYFLARGSAFDPESGQLDSQGVWHGPSIRPGGTPSDPPAPTIAFFAPDFEQRARNTMGPLDLGGLLFGCATDYTLTVPQDADAPVQRQIVPDYVSASEVAASRPVRIPGTGRATQRSPPGTPGLPFLTGTTPPPFASTPNPGGSSFGGASSFGRNGPLLAGNPFVATERDPPPLQRAASIVRESTGGRGSPPETAPAAEPAWPPIGDSFVFGTLDDADPDDDSEADGAIDDEISTFMSRMREVTLSGGFVAGAEDSGQKSVETVRVSELRKRLLHYKDYMQMPIDSSTSPPAADSAADAASAPADG